ncbi:hypothetical protein AGMMS49959_18980 [Planctomycetales bacterium]|nr:hypothetical protein AGMMS49959_18980 [Planctomycetales bacterium]
MQAIEFRTTIADGKIAVPEKYRHKKWSAVRVVMLVEEDAATLFGEVSAETASRILPAEKRSDWAALPRIADPQKRCPGIDRPFRLGNGWRWRRDDCYEERGLGESK